MNANTSIEIEDDSQTGPKSSETIQEHNSYNDDNTNEFNPQTKLDENRIIKHIMVIGFHHKHGYQVDYCYPPLEPEGPVFSTPTKPISLPSCWKTLPLLCLPDGSHNYTSDIIYFTMPENNQNKSINESGSPTDMTNGVKTIFGTACYRQVQADKLLIKTDDITRVAVQKSVCVLSSQPLFGLIRSKLEMITHAYFEELDFSKVKILKLTYDNLNSLLSRDSVKENATFLGLSARHLVSHFGNNVLVIFKAMLLEKKILFYKSPVSDLCSTILSMCSLFTGLLEGGGLDYSTCDLQLSSALLEALKLSTPSQNDLDMNDSIRENRVLFSSSKEEVMILSDVFDETHDLQDPSSCLPGREMKPIVSLEDQESSENSHATQAISRKSNQDILGEFEVIPAVELATDAIEAMEAKEMNSLSEDVIVDDAYALKICQQYNHQELGLPLQIFTGGSFCLPYLSISYLDLLSDTRVRSFVIGATNFLFKQRKEMYDIIVDMEEDTITINDPELKRCLNLTIEDLRFMDYLTRHVKMEANSAFDPINHDITKWLGGDEWIRYHFKLYTLYLLKCSLGKNQSACADQFNAPFVQTWKHRTNNYKVWLANKKSNILDKLQDRHPFSSSSKGINFNDMKLKLSHAVNSSERGRIVNQTLNGIGKWSIWNNIASAAAAATSAAASATSTLASTSNSGYQQTNRFDSDLHSDQSSESTPEKGKVRDI